MSIKNIIGAIVVSGLSLSTTSCYNQDAVNQWHNRDNLLEQVMSDKPQAELESIKKSFHEGNVKVAETQHKIDSIVFSEMFKGSEKAKDSCFVAHYNALMAKTKTPMTFDHITGLNISDGDTLRSILAEKLTVKEMKKVTEENPVLPKNGGKGYFNTGMQYLVDSVYHHKLFEKHDMLSNGGLQKFKNLCKKVRP